MDLSGVKSVLLLDGLSPKCAEILQKNGFQVSVPSKLTEDQLLQEITKYEAVVVRSATKVTDKVLEAGKKLKLVGRAGTGTDNIDIKAATRRGILVMNTPGGNTLSAAEHTCALICCLSRFIPQACASLKAGAWDRKLYMGNELNGKTLAIIGLGKIGKEVAQRMQSFGMSTIGFDPIVSVEEARSWGVASMSLEEIWPKADYITVHTPLIPQTKNLVGREVLFEKCKKGVKVVNVARGGIVDEAALLDALNAERCGGAGLDVFMEEPPADLSLCKHPKVVCTPHLGASTKEAQLRVAEDIAQQFSDAVAGKGLVGLVNGHSLAIPKTAENDAYLTLLTWMGKILALMVPHSDGGKANLLIETNTIWSGAVSKAIGNCAVYGYLQDFSRGYVNMVNASEVCSSKYQVEFNLVKNVALNEEMPRLKKIVTLQINSSSQKTCRITGTLNNGVPQLVSIDEYKWEMPFVLPPTYPLSLYSSKGTKQDAISSIASHFNTKNLGLVGILSSSGSSDSKILLAAFSDANQSADLKVVGLDYQGSILSLN